MRAGEREEAPGNMRMPHLLPEVRARWKTQQPDAADSFGAETFPQEGIARAGLFRWRDPGAVERLLNLAEDRRFHAGAKRGADGRGRDANFSKIGREQEAIGKDREKGRAVRGWNVDQGWAHLLEVTFEIGVRSFGGLRFEAQGQRGGFEPVGDRVNAAWEWGLGIGNARPSG